ncbi:MAG: hypothetical protein CL963_02260 [Euryarchaeota archaeon]|nr:hypothetical protein [Euryarchaeota archaeon]HIK01459.1 carbohydrate kinase family protein [Candidatus Undinarchaeales archaeon ERR594346 U_76725]|tara:strand:- start:24429 stop:25367 length:939 start_codon:yes stop_codon:yes gene_type:complete
MASKFDLVTVGNISIDTILVDKKCYRVPGGSAAAVATAAAANGAKCGIVSKLGRDYPSDWLSELRKAGVDTLGLGKKKASTRFELSYNRNKRLINFNEVFSSDAILSFSDMPDSYRNSQHVHLSAARPEHQENFLESLSNRGKRTVSLTLWSTYSDSYADKFIDLLKKTDILFCNNHEISSISNEENIYDAVKAVQRKGPKIIVLTKGELGSAICTSRKIHLFPALKTSRTDTTGCGDSFAGGFISEYLKSGNVARAGWLGSALASFTMQKSGAWFPSDIERNKILDTVKRAREVHASNGKRKTKGTLFDYF